MTVLPAKRLAVAAALAQKPHAGGHTWAILHYLLGFRQLGWDVLVVDTLDSRWCTDAQGQPCTAEQSVQARMFHDLMDRFGFGGRSVLVCDRDRYVGLDRTQTLAFLRSSAMLVNVMGYLDLDELLRAPGLRVFLDIDPGFPQMWRALGLHDALAGYDAHVTIGERIGEPDCTIPTCGIDWVRTPQPVVLEQWPVCPPVDGGAFTSVASWRGVNQPVVYDGRTYGLRVHEFRQFAALPQRTGDHFRLALDIHPAETRDLALLREHGWHLDDPREAAGSPDRYRAYVQASAAEFLTAKGMYVQSRSGWISDRSLCYLASGRPVLAQDTGFSERYPSEAGLVAYRTLDEACAGVAAIRGDYRRHARAARDVAEAYFDSTRVLGRVLRALGAD